MFYFKNAARDLARDIRRASHPAAVAVAVGSFFPHGDWNAIAGAFLWLSMQGSAFFLRAWADGMPDLPP